MSTRTEKAAHKAAAGLNELLAEATRLSADDKRKLRQALAVTNKLTTADWGR